MMPFMPNPFMQMPLIGGLPTAEQSAQSQRLALQNQHIQLKYLKQMAEQQIQAIDAALGHVQEALSKAETGEGEKSAETGQIPSVQTLAQTQTLNQAQALSQSHYARWQQQYRLQDCQAWYQGGMGDFGRPIF